MGGVSACAGKHAPDFDALGKQIARSTYGRNELSSIWKHPETGAEMFVGNQNAAHKRSLLTTYDITHVVCCLEQPHRIFDGEIIYFHFPIAMWRGCDNANTVKGVARIFAPLLGYVATTLEQGNSVLLHCVAGAHRAGTCGIACLMHLSGMDAARATIHAKARRQVIDPIFDLASLLQMIQLAIKELHMEEAIRQAEKVGYQKAIQFTFKLPDELEESSASGGQAMGRMSSHDPRASLQMGRRSSFDAKKEAMGKRRPNSRNSRSSSCDSRDSTDRPKRAPSMERRLSGTNLGRSNSR